ncbi:hypothetical protein I350_04336 [Cryptococcus amylolentus CBS 6273]|uniref:Uncharacterized protein n=1 Tax=Cryptococcus amylolentus CBS 6273 TaxID=1296118 RepID=A0A1E3K1R9_9TREE|nr:hypothetical protein I350_04336 [Cryptococcus amylolentus CBS 6273]
MSDPPPPYRSLISAIHRPSDAGTPSRRSEPDRESLSDLSLHTLRRTALTKAQQQRVQELIGSGGHGRMIAGEGLPGRTSEVDDDAKYWTARGTLRSVLPGSDEGVQGRASEETSRAAIEEREVLVLVHEPNSITGPDGRSGQTPSEAGTLPSRFLYIFHPPDPPSMSGSANSSSYPLGLQWDELNPWEWIETAKNELEKAFWGVLMPGVKGLVDMGEAVASIPALLSPGTEHALGLQSDRQSADATAGSHNPHRYAQETVYTMRIPQQNARDSLDLGPTLRPVLIKKRSSIPTWEDGRDSDHRGWGRDPMAMGARY